VRVSDLFMRTLCDEAIPESTTIFVRGRSCSRPRVVDRLRGVIFTSGGKVRSQLAWGKQPCELHNTYKCYSKPEFARGTRNKFRFCCQSWYSVQEVGDDATSEKRKSRKEEYEQGS